MNQVRINETTHHLPSTWTEVTATQWKHIADYLLIDRSFRSAWHKAELVRKLITVPRKVWKLIPPEAKYDLCQLLNFIETDLFTHPIITSFRHHDTVYLVPQKEYSNVRIIEYAFADEFYNRIVADATDADSLNKFVATLCRPPISHLNELDPLWDGDPREQFNPILMEQRAATFNTLAPHIKLMVCLQFIGCTDHIHEQYKLLFPKPDEDEEKKPLAFGRGVKLNFGWMGTLHEAVATGWFGDWEKTAYTFIHKILYHFLMEKAKHTEVIPDKQQTMAA